MYRLTCGGEGEWWGPHCVAVVCNEPAIVQIGLLINCTDGYNAGSKCLFKCPESTLVHTTQCYTNASWSLDNPCILPNISCDAPESTDHILLRCPNETFVGKYVILLGDFRCDLSISQVQHARQSAVWLVMSQ